MATLLLKDLLPENINGKLYEEEVDDETKDLSDELKKMLDSEISSLKNTIEQGMKFAQSNLKGKSEDDAEKLVKSKSSELAKVVESYKVAKLKESKGEISRKKLNEFIDPFTAASIALALPKIIEWTGKIAKKIAQKMGKEGNIGAAIEHFGHNFHMVYIKIIRKVLDVTLFLIPKLKKLDDAKKNKIAEIFFMIIVATMGYFAGTSAMQYLENSELFHGVFEGLMSVVKGGEVAEWTYKALSPIFKAATL